MAEPMTDGQLADLRERAEAFTKAVDLELSKDSGEPYNHGLDYYLSTAGEITRRVPALLDEVERLRDSVSYYSGPEECVERECEEYFDEEGNDKPNVTWCSHVTEKTLTYEEYVEACNERDRLAPEVNALNAQRYELARLRDEAKAAAGRFAVQVGGRLAHLRSLLNNALALHRAPANDEAWRDWERDAEAAIRKLDDAEVPGAG